ncbi:MAG: hypothetical protein QW667_07270 [Candidatus Bathyarchaeia archaeon]
MSQNDLNKILLEAIEEGLSILGESSKHAILFHLEIMFKIRREDIPNNLTEFIKALEGIFGPGAAYLEKLIVKKLYEKLGLEFDDAENFGFLDHVNKVENHLLVRRKSR